MKETILEICREQGVDGLAKFNEYSFVKRPKGKYRCLASG